MISDYTTHGEGVGVVEQEFFAANVEGIESIGAVGAVFEQVFLGLREFFAEFILAEAVASVGDTGGLNGKDKVFVVGTESGVISGEPSTRLSRPFSRDNVHATLPLW